MFAACQTWDAREQVKRACKESSPASLHITHSKEHATPLPLSVHELESNHDILSTQGFSLLAAP